MSSVSTAPQIFETITHQETAFMSRADDPCQVNVGSVNYVGLCVRFPAPDTE